MSTSYLELLIKSEKSYPVVKPYLDSTAVIINYPPAYDVMVCMLSSFFPKIPLVTTQMVITICCVTFLGLIIFHIVRRFTKKTLLGLGASLITTTGTLMWYTAQGDTEEFLSMLAASVFILFLETVYKNEKKMKFIDLLGKQGRDILIVKILAGVFFSLCLLGHPRIFQYYFFGFIFFIFFILALYPERKEFLKSTLIVFIGFALITFPWTIPVLLRYAIFLPN